MNAEITVLSLIVALLSVLLSPLVALAISRRANANALRVAKKNIIAPMRQRWIDSVRDTVAELTSLMHHYYVAEGDDHSDGEESLKKIHFLERRLSLLLNPQEEHHKRLVALFRQVIHSLEFQHLGEMDMARLDSEVIACTQMILKSEWQRVKDEE
ncbi:MAG: hypothetical protein RLZZ129_2640 [Verrucomicrobiota bacterium]